MKVKVRLDSLELRQAVADYIRKHVSAQIGLNDIVFTAGYEGEELTRYDYPNYIFAECGTV